MDTTFRTTVFKQAHVIERTTGKKFSVALAKAWQLHHLATRLRKGVVTFSFECKDGSLRKAKGTLVIPNNGRLVRRKYTERHKTFRYFDVERQAFRSFRTGSLVTIYQEPAQRF